MKAFKRLPLSLAVAIGSLSSSTWAAVEDPGYVQWEGVKVTPTVKAGIGYDDNVYKEGKAGNLLKEKGSLVYTLAPAIEFLIESGASYALFTLEAENTSFSSENDHNFTDYGADLDLTHEFNSRNRLNLKGGYGVGHDQGSAAGGESDRTPPEYKQQTAGFNYGFGAMEAMARIDVFADYDAKDYVKVGSQAADSGEDRKTKSFGATGYYQLMPKTDLLLEARQRNLSYDNVDDAGFKVSSYLVGLSWDATAKTSGSVKVGHRNRKSDVNNVDDEGYTGWEVGVIYQPVDHSTIMLNTGRDYGLESENPSDASFTKGSNVSIMWNHNWTSKISTDLGYTHTNDDVQNAAGTTYKERTVNTYTLGVNWAVLRNLTLGLNLENSKRDEKAKQTDVSEDGYSRNAYMLTADYAM